MVNLIGMYLTVLETVHGKAISGLGLGGSMVGRFKMFPAWTGLTQQPVLKLLPFERYDTSLHTGFTLITHVNIA